MSAYTGARARSHCAAGPRWRGARLPAVRFQLSGPVELVENSGLLVVGLSHCAFREGF